jgi:Dockerin type I domain
MILIDNRSSRRSSRGRWFIAICAFSVTGTVFYATVPSVQALTFNLSYDASTNSAPAGFAAAFNDAIQFYETNFTDPITINLQVGWGEVAGQSLPPSALGESSASQPGFFQYGTIKSLLVADAKSAADLSAVANLPASDPTGGATFKISRAQGKALGITIGDGSALDGSVGFNSADSFTFDPNNRAVAGKVDFIGVAEHEISEVMGRFGQSQNGAPSGRYGPIDLFRYSSPGILDLVPANGAYFSIDGGTTAINTFNGIGGGDLSDWAGATPDSYNASIASGLKVPVTPGDITVMDVIGYDALLPGDFNRDGQVNVADIQAMTTALADLSGYESQKALTDAQLQLLGDLNGDGQITNADIQMLISLVANSGGGNGSLTAVPEPSAAFLILYAMTACALIGRRRSGA